MAVAGTERSRLLFSNKDWMLFIAGSAITFYGMDQFQITERIQSEVNKSYPQTISPEDLTQANELTKAFDTNNGLSVRRGELTMSVSHEVASRLQWAYGIQDSESDRLRKQQTQAAALRSEAIAINLDPANFKIGRVVQGAAEAVGGLALSLGTFFRADHRRSRSQV